MQLFVYVTILFLLLVGNVSAQNTGTPGRISGTVNFCGKGGVLGMKISLSGRQMSIYTADDGKFLFEQVPAGDYALFYVINERVVHVSNGVTVASSSATDLGEVAFCVSGAAKISENLKLPQTENKCVTEPSAPECVDKDKDGVVAGNDCNDNDENVHPGAPEVCDGIDNNCNGKVDELGKIRIENGTGICQQGSTVVRSCDRGFADCDGKIENGCETNLMEDNENCGACGNACPANEICVAGMC